MYDFELDKTAAEISKRNAKLIVVQFAEGLKIYAEQVIQSLEKATGATFILSADPTWGGCDIDDVQAKLHGADLLLHFGHNDFCKESEIPVLYVPVRSTLDVIPLLKAHIEELRPHAPLGLTATVQHMQTLPDVQEFLTASGIESYIGTPSSRAEVAGQVLGCDCSSALDVALNAKSYLYIGGGDFHPLGVALATGKTCFILDPFRRELRDTDGLVKRVKAKRWDAITRARSAKRWGIVVGLKKGQGTFPQAFEVKKRLESEDRQAMILTAREVSDTLLAHYSFEAYVMIACPRLPTDDQENFKKPILTPQELYVMFSGSLEDFPYVF